MQRPVKSTANDSHLDRQFIKRDPWTGRPAVLEVRSGAPITREVAGSSCLERRG